MSCTAKPEPNLISRSEFVYLVDIAGIIGVRGMAEFFEKGGTNGAITHSIQGLHTVSGLQRLARQRIQFVPDFPWSCLDF